MVIKIKTLKTLNHPWHSDFTSQLPNVAEHEQNYKQKSSTQPLCRRKKKSVRSNNKRSQLQWPLKQSTSDIVANMSMSSYLAEGRKRPWLRWRWSQTKPHSKLRCTQLTLQWAATTMETTTIIANGQQLVNSQMAIVLYI